MTEKQVVEPNVTPEPVPAEPKKEDLVTRVSQVKAEVSAAEPKPDEVFNVNDIDKIEDPKAKEYAEKAYKSFQRGFNKKYEELAALRKDLEKKGEASSTWTVEKVQSLLKDESFVNAARSVTAQNPNGLTDEEYSALTDTEKAKLNNLESEVSNLRKLNYEAYKVQQDEQLKRKYANYDSSIIDTTSADLISGRAIATREHLWKVIDYDKAIRRAYELGLQDRKLETSDRLNSMSADGINTVPSGNVPEPEKGESDTAYFKRLANKRLKEAGRK